MLRCEECECISTDATGWAVYFADDPEESADRTAAAYCPPCAHREFAQPMPYRVYL